MLTQNNGFDHTGYNSLLSLPALLSSVRYSPCNNKKYYLKHWHSSPKTISYCQAEITSGKANGYGLITGEIDGVGIVALDFDGVGSDDLAKVISPSLLEDNTLAWSSGKTGHFSKAFIIPKPHLPFWSGVQKHDITADSADSSSPHLEIRYNAHASVIPPSAHPETKCYKWLNDKGIRHLTFNESYALLDKCTISTNDDLTGDQELNLIEEALTFIPSDDYHVWTTVGMALYKHGCDYSLWDSWSMNSAKYNPKGMDKKWQSFSKANRVNIGTLFHLASTNGFDQRRWMRENLKRQRQALNHTIKNDPIERKSLDTNESIPIINQFLEEKSKILREDERKIECTKFCHQYNLNYYSIWNALEAKVKRLNEQLEYDSLNSLLDDLINIPKKQLDLHYLVGEYYATILNESANFLSTNPDALFLLGLPQLATLIGHRQRVKTRIGFGLKVYPKIRLALIADSGKGKSPALNLANLGIKEYHTRIFKDSLNRIKEWESLPPEEQQNEEKPSEKHIITSDFTWDGVYKLLVNNPSMLILREELSGFFEALKAKGGYNKDSVQRSLEAAENNPIIKTRQDTKCSYFIEKHNLSFVGTLQWSMFRQWVNDESDEAGESPRWFFIAPELPEIVGHEEDEDLYDIWVSFQELMVNTLAQADLPEEITLSDEARGKLLQWFNVTSKEQRVNAHLIQDKSRRQKMLGETAKLAHLLHHLTLMLNPAIIDDESVINGQIMDRALYLSDYLLAHFTYCLTKAKENFVGGKEMRVLEKIIDAGDKGIASSDIQKKLGGGNKNAMKLDEVNKIVLQLLEMNQVTQVKVPRGLKVKAKS